MKVLTIGFGGTGVVYSYILQQGGASVTAVARSNYHSVNQDGIHFKSAKFGDHKGWKPDHLLPNPSEASKEHYDYVLYTAKLTPDVSPTEDIIRPYLSTSTPQDPTSKKPVIVLIQNGVGIEDSVYEALVVKDKLASGVISCVAWIGTNLIQGGTVVEHGALERLEMGIFPAPKVRDSSDPSLQADKDALDAFLTTYKKGGGGGEFAEDIQPNRWKKLLWNASWGALSTLARQPVAALITPTAQPYTIPVVKALMEEVLSVGRSIGLDESVFPKSSMENALAITLSPNASLSPDFKASLLIDLENNRPMELIPIIGNVVERARKGGVKVPRLEMAFAGLWPCQEQAVKASKEKLGLYNLRFGGGENELFRK